MLLSGGSILGPPEETRPASWPRHPVSGLHEWRPAAHARIGQLHAVAGHAELNLLLVTMRKPAAAAKRWVSTGRQGRAVAARCSSYAIRPSATFPAGRETAVRASMVWMRSRLRRAHRQWPRAAADQDRARLDGQISGRRRRTCEPQREDRLHRRRALWRRRRWIAKLRADAGADRRQARSAARLLRLRSSASRRLGPSRASRSSGAKSFSSPWSQTSLALSSPAMTRATASSSC